MIMKICSHLYVQVVNIGGRGKKVHAVYILSLDGKLSLYLPGWVLGKYHLIYRQLFLKAVIWTVLFESHLELKWIKKYFTIHWSWVL